MISRKKSHVFILVIIITISLISGVLIAGFFRLQKDLPSPEAIQNFKPASTVKVYDCKNRLICEFYEQQRMPVHLEQMPKYLKDALIAVEDKRFYSHWGLDLIRLFGATLYGIKSLKAPRGTSTITQQLARTMFLTLEHSLARKIKEALLALQLERVYSKEEILELYLNLVYFGQGVYGVEAAANAYFNKPVQELTLPECALIAALPKAPEYYNNNPKALLKRRNFFLKMLNRHQKISRKEMEEAMAAPLGIVQRQPLRNEAAYFIEEVRKYLEQRYGYDFINRSGARIYTSLDLDMQRLANQSLEDFLTRLEKDYKLKDTKRRYDSLTIRDSMPPPPSYLQGALVAIDPKTGFVKAMIGGRDFKQSPYNRAIQAKRQAGSAFKVFVYTAAIENGFLPSDLELDEPLTLSTPGSEPYTPVNFDFKFLGPITLRRALALSRNIVAVRLISRLGPEVVARYANLMGIEEKLRPYYSLALGASEVNLLELTRGFSVLANEGTKTTPIMITKIVDVNGQLLEENFPERQPVLSPQTAYIMTGMLRSVIDEGTGYAVRLLGFDRPAAGKTGTTDDYTDTWFVGFTPNLACGVWVGYDQKKTIFQGAVGGSVAAPIWADFMKQATDSLPNEDFIAPDSITYATICEQTGLLASSRCPKIRQEIYKVGTEPKEECIIHRFRTGRETFEFPDIRYYPGF
ncbi:MAG: penicillin-binding protein 1A [bacterium]